ncbi:glycosyltransferase family 9 protein [Photobacterium kagoshimensis]|uniref:glycosyltransferase family 9 protein n=1 Tax=Photobacterium kagoshimensis TaxID=2910242 RepID=UPI003D0B0523
MGFKNIIHKIRLGRDLLRRRIGLWLFDKKTVPVFQKKELKEIVVVRWDAKIGDSIVSSFFFREIKKIFPNVKVSVITTPEMQEMYKKDFLVDNVYLSKKRPSYSDLNELARKTKNADLVVHLSKILKMKDLFFLSRFKNANIAGLDDSVNLVDLKLGKSTAGEHFSYKYKKLINAYSDSNVSEEYIIPSRSDIYDRLSSQIKCDKKLIAINPYGSSTVRRLSNDSIREILKLLQENIHDFKVVFICAPQDRVNLKVIVDEYPNLCLDGEFGDSIYHAIELVRLADYVITVDTSIVHIASGLNKHLLSLYNPNMINHKEWSPKSEKNVTLFSLQNDINSLDESEIGKVICEQFKKR